ncbi:alpha-E domain-containing protein [Thiomicrorhabdus sp. Kp2]|uniref:alpha-E domain-containing protein n=1 Tax=Thiomicrorhabdus sp. Kp2 TaxID=1123518 RepID=UPI00040ABE49|nr:alpha-E domain-containing protein [Thiomicrorhabdus sp. Kp2]
MLSRVAERIYWLARYIERIENTARLTQVHSQLMFDMPKSVKLSWYTLIEITSNEDFFEEHYDAKTEKNCCWAILGDRDNSASLISSLWWARENVRTTRDSLPREAWIYVNELYLLVKENEEDFNVRRKRNELLEQVIRSCQAISGMLDGTMRLNKTFQFLQLGTAIERADMTSRILDVGGFFVAQELEEQEIKPFESILWANILKSVSAYFMYRQAVQMEINGKSVIRFLVNDPLLFRSIKHCVCMMHTQVATLPESTNVTKALEDLQTLINQSIPFELGSPVLHDYLDEVQMHLSVLHKEFYNTWFHPTIDLPTNQQQSQ